MKTLPQTRMPRGRPPVSGRRPRPCARKSVMFASSSQAMPCLKSPTLWKLENRSKFWALSQQPMRCLSLLALQVLPTRSWFPILTCLNPSKLKLAHLQICRKIYCRLTPPCRCRQKRTKSMTLTQFLKLIRLLFCPQQTQQTFLPKMSRRKQLTVPMRTKLSTRTKRLTLAAWLCCRVVHSN